MPVTIPPFLTTNTSAATILAAMLAQLPNTIDQSQGSFLYDALAPASIEMAQAAVWLQQMLQRCFAETTFGAYLDLRGDEHGIFRKPAVGATGVVTFTGTNGTVILPGVQVSTAGASGVPSAAFVTTATATISLGSVNAPIVAVAPGAAGNVSAVTVVLLSSIVAGVTGVTNGAPTTGGVDVETDAAFLDRYLAFVANPPAGGNAADYINWAESVSGVGEAACVPLEGGAGNVAVAIVDTNLALPTQALIDLVQQYISPPVVLVTNALSTPGLVIAGGSFGVTTDATQGDSLAGTCDKMVYSASGIGSLTETNIHASLAQAGVWTVRIRVKVDSIADATNNLLELGVHNDSTAAWAQTAFVGGVDSHVTDKASQLAVAFADYNLTFAWNGTDHLTLQVNRLQANTTATVWVDQARYVSTFSDQLGSGKAPIGARVTVRAPGVTTVSVSVHLVLISGANLTAAQNAVNAAITAYLIALTFSSLPNVLYSRIATAILGAVGVADYNSLTVNGGTANLVIVAGAMAAFNGSGATFT